MLLQYGVDIEIELCSSPEYAGEKTLNMVSAGKTTLDEESKLLITGVLTETDLTKYKGDNFLQVFFLYTLSIFYADQIDFFVFIQNYELVFVVKTVMLFSDKIIIVSALLLSTLFRVDKINYYHIVVKETPCKTPTFIFSSALTPSEPPRASILLDNIEVIHGEEALSMSSTVLVYYQRSMY